MPQQQHTVEQALQIAIQQHQAGKLNDAERIYRQILQVAPNHPQVLHNLGEIAYRGKQMDAALALVDRALRLAPEAADYHNTRAVILFASGNTDASWESCQTALKYNPRLTHAYSNMGVCLADRGDLKASIRSFERAIEIDPNNAVAHDGLGLSSLMAGDLQRGWLEQEWRWLKPGYEKRRYADQPQWTGQELAGKTILLHAEQGYGDLFQFARYAPLLTARGATVLLEVVPEVLDVMKSLKGVAQLVAGPPTPRYDFVCPQMSVPLHYGTTLETIPEDVPYLFPDPDLTAQWAAYFKKDPNFKIGIGWAGRASHNNDRNRSTKLATFEPLSTVPGVTLYSLQKGSPRDEIDTAPMKVKDLSPWLGDFSATAAAIANLDLLISVDTSIVHLAGAMGKPVWNLLPFCPDWRWMMDREDTPWYPTMRLLRHRYKGDWAGVMDRAKTDLEKLLASR